MLRSLVQLILLGSVAYDSRPVSVRPVSVSCVDRGEAMMDDRESAAWFAPIRARARIVLDRAVSQHLLLKIPAPTVAELAKMIDHTLLKPEATPNMVEASCAEAREYRFASVCVNPVYVSLCARALKNSDVVVCSVIGFPLGASTSEIKAAEAQRAIADGALRDRYGHPRWLAAIG